MSAMNSYVSSDGSSGYLLTDSAATLQQGDTGACAFPGKTFTLPHLRLCFATCGYSQLGTVFSMLASQFSSFDDLAAKFRDPWRKAMGNAVALEASAGWPSIKSAVLVLGWSDSEKRVKAFVSQQTREWEPQFFDLILVPDCDIEIVQHHDFSGPVIFASPGRDLLRIMQVQRKNALAATDNDHRGLIGGHVVLTEQSRW